MNVMFIVGSWSVGGVERVTRMLADGLSAHGHAVCIVAHDFKDRKLLDGCNDRIKTVQLSRRRRTTALRQILREEAVDVVINQWALPASVTWMIRRAARGLGVKIIEVQHNAPDRNNRMLCAHCGLERFVWKALTALNLRIVYSLCDRYVFLAPGVADAFFRFTGIRNRAKSVVIPNPVEMPEAMHDVQPKENLILFVGRLSEPEKRPSRVLEAWRLLSDKLPDWKLEIVGDGPDRKMLERMAGDLPHVNFVGFQNPSSYYRRAKFLLLTSEYEGFGLVLIEAMARGCVPVAYGGCAAVRDLLNGRNGIAVQGLWNTETFTKVVLELAGNDERRRELARQGIAEANAYGLEEVLSRYEAVMEGL